MSIIFSGNEHNAVGAGLFFESYWNFGWAGPPVALIIYGALLAALSRYALNVVLAQRWLFLPILFMCMKVGIAADDHLINQFGAVVVIVCMHFVIKAMSRIFGWERRFANAQTSTPRGKS